MAIEGGRISWSTGVDLGGLKKGLKEAGNIVKKSALGAVWDTASFVSGMKMSKNEVKNFGKEVSRLRDQFEDLRDMRANMQKSGLWDSFSADARKAVDEAVDVAKTQAKAYTRTFRAMKAGNTVKNFFGNAWRGLGKIIEPLRKKVVSFGKDATRSFGMGARRLLGIATAGAIVYKALQYMREGFANLTKADTQTRNSVNQLRGALQGLKNALGAAFAPIVNTVAPILTKFINMLTSAANAVASFISALLGKKYVVVADSVGAISDGFEGVSGNASDANSEAKKLQRTLMGFDKINKLDGNDSSGGSGGSGGGSSGGASGGGFSLVPVNDTANAWADKFRESWEKADFEWLGTLLGEKLRDALDKIPWDTIQEGARKLALSLTSFLKGFLTVDGLAESVGNTIAQALNTAIIFAKNFVDTAPFEELGEFVATTLNTFVKKAKWKDLGHTISGAIVGVLKAFNSFVSNTDWEAVGSAIVKFFEGIQWGELFSNALTLIGSIAEGIFKAVKGAFSTAIDDLQDWLDREKPLSNLHAKADVDVRPEWAIHIEEGSFDTPDTNFWLAIDKWLKDKRKQIAKAIADAFTGFGVKLTDLLIPDDPDNTFWTKLDKALDDIRKGIANWWKDHKPNLEINLDDKFSGAWNKIKGAWEGLKDKKATLTTALSGLKEKAITAIGNAWKNVSTKKAKLTAKLSGVSAKTLTSLANAWSKIKGGTKNLALNLKASVASGYNKMATKINSLLDKLPKAVRPSWRLPKLAQGGYVKANTPQLAMIGDNKREGEIVAPESKLQEMANKASGGQQTDMLLKQILAALQGMDMNVYLDGEQIKNNVVRRINNHTRATGQLEIIV